jgi:hypothetical protein
MSTKSSNLFGRLVWIVDLIRRKKKISFQDINKEWLRSGLNFSEDNDLSIRTFHNHCDAIRDIFNIDIVCEKCGQYRYYIENPEDLANDNFRNWLVDSYATLNQVRADSRLEGRIIFEDIPSGHDWLTTITEAMHKNSVLRITYQGFGRDYANSFEIEPYCLKVVNRRWYVIARSPYYSERNRKKNQEQGHKELPEDVYRVYALDRITNIEDTDQTFTMNKRFSIDDFFEGCCGIIVDKELPTERVVIKAYENGPNYLRTLPLHESQIELPSNDDEAAYFEYHLKPNFDFYQLLLSQADQIEVVEPESVREEMHNFAKNILSYYEKEENQKCKE